MLLCHHMSRFCTRPGAGNSVIGRSACITGERNDGLNNRACHSIKKISIAVRPTRHRKVCIGPEGERQSGGGGGRAQACSSTAVVVVWSSRQSPPMVNLSENEGIENRRFVVTGGAGFIGRALCLELARRGAAEVRSFDRRALPNQISQLQKHGVVCITGDIRRKEDVAKAFKQANCVFHLASFGMSGKEMLQTRQIDEVNLNGTCNVLDCCVTCGVERLVYTSTYNVVFGGKEIRNGNEAMEYYPLEDHVDPYGRSKALAEQLVLKYNNRPLKIREGRKLYTCALRPAAIYGPGEERHFPRILRMAEAGLYLTHVGGPDTKQDWVYVDNLVHAQLLASMALLDDIPDKGVKAPAAGQAYFISDGTELCCNSQIPSDPR